MRVFFTLAALAVIAVTACTGVKAQEAEVYSIRIGGVASDGVMVPPTPTPTPSPTPSPVPTATRTPYIAETRPHWNPDVERWRWLVMDVFYGASSAEIDYILAIMQCESGGNPNATGAQGERGLLQVHPRWHPDATYDPEGNLRAAYRISNGGRDWSAWSCA